MVVIAIIGILVAALLPTYVHIKARSRTTTCEENLRNMATTCEIYAQDYDGAYPTSLTITVGTYVQALPTCPSAGDLGASYRNGMQTSANPNAYTLWCNGDYHADTGLSPNFPQFISGVGIQE